MPAGTWALFENVCRQRMSSEIGVQVSAGGAELLDPVSSRVYGQRPGGYTRRVGCYLGAA